MITARRPGKTYGAVPAVDDLSFDVRPGVVTGFPGPNGAGRSTTMRLMLGDLAAEVGALAGLGVFAGVTALVLAVAGPLVMRRDV